MLNVFNAAEVIDMGIEKERKRRDFYGYAAKKFKMKDMKESVEKFLQTSYVTNLTVDGNVVTLKGNSRKIVAEVVDVGDYDTVIGRNFLSEAAFGVGRKSVEANILEGIIGDCQILPLGKYLCVSRDDQIMLLKNTEIDYNRN